MGKLSTVLLLCIISCVFVEATDEIRIQVGNRLDNMPCWVSIEKLITLCKTYVTTVQQYTAQEARQSGTNNLIKTEDNVLAAQVAVDDAFNECQNILNVSAAFKLALQNEGTPQAQRVQ